MTTRHEGDPSVESRAQQETTSAHPGRTPGATTGQEPTHAAPQPPVAPAGVASAPRRDLVRWGPLWAGIVVAIATYLVMQLAIFASGLFTDGGGGTGTWLSAIAGFIAFFLGGMAASATALWDRVGDGAVNGALLWAFATVGLLLLAILGGGTIAGPISTVAADLGAIQDLNLQSPPAEQVEQALEGARGAAGWTLLGLGLSLVAAVAGGATGARIWPGGRR